MSAWVPRFVYRNLLDTLIDGPNDIGLFNNSAATNFPVTNLQAAQPSVALRTSAAPHADFRLSVLLHSGTTLPLSFDTVWIGYTNATAHRNLLTHGNTFTSWTETNVADFGALVPMLRSGFRGYEYQAIGGGALKHNLSNTWVTWTTTTNNADVDDLTFTVDLAEATADAVDKIRVAIVNVGSGDEISVDIDLADGSLTSVAVTGTDFPTGDATVTAFTPVFTAGDTHSSIATGYTLSLHADLATGAELNNIRCDIRMLMAGSETFTQAGETFFCSAAQLEIGTTATDPVANSTDIGALMTITSVTRDTTPDPTELFSYITSRKLMDFKTDVGWVHGAAKIHAATVSSETVVFRIRDTGNLDSYFEIGSVVIGTSLKPTGVLVAGDASHKGSMEKIRRTWEAGRWVYEMDFDYLDADTAEREFLDMYRYANKNDDGAESVRSAGGQRYSRRKGVLLIADTGAGTSEPERVIYGELLGSAPLASAHGSKSRITVRIGEFPK